MVGRDSKKGGRQNGFCRPLLKEPQLRILMPIQQLYRHGICLTVGQIAAGRTRMPLSTTAGQG